MHSPVHLCSSLYVWLPAWTQKIKIDIVCSFIKLNQLLKVTNIYIVNSLMVKSFLYLGTHSWTLVCGRSPADVEMNMNHDAWWENIGSFCLFKILMASALLRWGRWPFLGHLPTALLLWNLCWNASKPTVFTLFSRSATSVSSTD